MKNALKRIAFLLLAAVMTCQLFVGCGAFDGLSTKIKVSYMTGSTEYVVQEYDLNEQITLPADPTMDGQKFIGWYTDEACTQPYAEGKITKGFVLYAKFEPSVIYIIVNTDGGEKIPMQAIVPGGQYSLPEAKKEGYTFTGYYYMDKNGERQDFPTSGVLPFDTDTVVIASYTINKYAITLYDGFSAEPTVATVEYNGLYTPNKASRPGYTFVAWHTTATNQTDDTIYDATKPIKGDVNLYAQYTANAYTITIANNVDSTTETVNVTYDAQYALTAADKTGYDFVGYEFNGEEFAAKGTYTHAQDVRITAKYATKTYSVTFKDADTGAVITTKNVEHGKTVSEPTKELTKTGYSYSLSSDLSGAITSDTEVLVTYTANAYKITIISNVAGVEATTVDVAYNSTYNLTAQDVTGYTFQNFMFDGEVFNASGTYTYLQNITIMANYALNEYTVTFKEAGTGEVLATQEVAHGGKAVEPNLARPGYSYTLSADLGEAITSDKEITVTYVANAYKITIISSIAGVEAITKDVAYNGTYNLTAQDVTGYTFENFMFDGEVFDASGTYTYLQNITIIANYTLNEYTVTFTEADSGEVLATQEVAHGGKAVEPNLTKFGYTYTLSADLGEAITSDKEIIVTYTAKTAVVTVNGAQAGYTLPTIVFGGTFTLAEPTKAGHNFVQFTGSNGKTYLANTEYTCDFENVTLTAEFDGDEKTVIFMVDGEQLSESIVLRGETVARPATDPSKEGYTFKGWSSVENELVAYDFSKGVEGTTYIYAYFAANTYAITINLAGGTGATSLSVTYGAAYDLTTIGTPTRKGYIFDGYKLGDNVFATKGTYNVAGNTEIVAQWKEDKKTVTFYVDGNVYTTENVLNGDKVHKPNDPSKEGYSFDKWYTDQAFTKAYDFTTEVTANTLLYAKFTANTYTITINLAGGTGATSLSVTYGAAYDLTTIGTPTRKGYIFDGYNYPLTGTYNVAGNTEIVAQWKEDNKKVTFYVDGNVYTTENVLNGNKVHKPNDPSKEGYAFNGWYNDQAYTREYDFTAEVTADTTLYAKFTANTYTITINLDGGTGKTSLSVVYGEAYDLSDLGTPTKKGYIFNGYNYPTTGTYNVAGNKEIVAQWKEDKKTVTFYADGSVFKTEDVLNGYTVAAPTTVPQKVGYTFVGWKLGDKVWDFSTEVTTDITLTANFTVNTYTLTIDNAGGTGEATRQIAYGSAYNLTAPTKDGYEFVRYERNGAEFPLSGEYNYAESITVTAVWKQTLTEGTKWWDDQEKGVFVYLVGYKYTFSNTGITIDEFISGDHTCVSISGTNNAVLEASAPCEFKVTVSKYDIEGNVTQSYTRTMKIVESIVSFTTGNDYANVWVKKNRTNFDNQEKNDLMLVGRVDFRPDVKVEKLVNDKLVSLTLAEANVDIEVLADGAATTDYTMNGDSFTFGTALVGKTITVKLSPRYAVYDNQSATFTFVLNNAVNVYDNATFKAAYVNEAVTEINVLRNITLELSEDQIHVATGNETTKECDGATLKFSVAAGTKAPINQVGGTAAYDRLKGNLTVNGNYFTADGSKILLVDNRIDKWTGAAGSAKNGYILQNVQFSLFKFGDMNTFCDDTLKMSNLYVLGNMGEAVNYGQNDGESYKIMIGENSYNMLTMSGAAIGIQARHANVDLDNVTIRRTVIGFHTFSLSGVRTSANPAGVNLHGEVGSLHPTSLYMKDCIVEQNWANDVYSYGPCLITLDSCELGSSSGPAIHFDALPTPAGVSVNSKLILKSGTTITNLLAGNETWFNAYDMSSLAGSMKSAVDDIVKKYGLTILQKDTNGTEKLNFAIMVKEGGGSVSEWLSDPDGMPTVDVVGVNYFQIGGYEYVQFDTLSFGMTGKAYMQGYLGLYMR